MFLYFKYLYDKTGFEKCLNYDNFTKNEFMFNLFRMILINYKTIFIQFAL